MEELSSVDLHSREVTSHGRELKPLHHLSVDLYDVSRGVGRVVEGATTLPAQANSAADAAKAAGFPAFSITGAFDPGMYSAVRR
jgi:hypothetical protein